MEDVIEVRKVDVMMTFEFKDTRMLPLKDLIDYIGYRLNLSCGDSALVKLTDVKVLRDTGIPVEG